MTIARSTVWNSGDTLTAAALNAEFNGLVNNAMDKTGANLAIGSDADGDMYYRASSVLARLAKGSANLKLFMNAAASAPEWASGVQIGTFTRAMDADSGDVEYNLSAVAFKPSVVIFIAHAPDAGISIGFSNAAVHYSIYGYAASAQWGNNATAAIAGVDKDGGGQFAYIASMDADGFTLTWTKTLTPTAGNLTVFYLAFR